MSDRPKSEGQVPPPAEDSRAARDEARHRQAAVLLLEAAAETDVATRDSLRRRAAELLSPHRRD
jgi:hypothetical protein